MCSYSCFLVDRGQQAVDGVELFFGGQQHERRFALAPLACTDLARGVDLFGNAVLFIDVLAQAVVLGGVAKGVLQWDGSQLFQGHGSTPTTTALVSSKANVSRRALAKWRM